MRVVERLSGAAHDLHRRRIAIFKIFGNHRRFIQREIAVGDHRHLATRIEREEFRRMGIFRIEGQHLEFIGKRFVFKRQPDAPRKG